MKRLLKPVYVWIVYSFSSLSAADTHQILYHITKGNIPIACDLYAERKKDQNREEPAVLQELGLRILREGIASHDPETQLLSLWGAGISGDDRALSILQKGLLSRDPNLQMAAVQFLVDRQHDAALEILDQALASPFLPVRLKALSALVSNRSPKALAHVESLMHKAPAEARLFFAEMLVVHGGVEATRTVRKLLNTAEEQTVVAAVLAMVHAERDDLLPEIRRLAGSLNAAQQEVCAYALGAFKDSSSLPQLRNLALSPVVTVRVAALVALHKMGDAASRLEIEVLAKKGHLPAVQALAEVEGSETTLRMLQDSSMLNIRLNAALALLRQKSPLKTELYRDVFVQDHRDIVFAPLQSPGRIFTSWSATPCARQRFKESSEIFENSLRLRERLLLQVSEISETELLRLSHLLFEEEQNDLIPALTRILAETKSPEAIRQLKAYREKAGAPWIRNYCNLALYRAKAAGPYVDDLMEWIRDYRQHTLVSINRTEATSQLLLESLEAMIQARDEQVLPLLLDLIRYGNPKNRYALAGILIRAGST